MVYLHKLAILSVVLILVAVVLASVPERAQGGDADATIGIGSGTVAPGGDITVDVTVSPSTAVVVSAGINIIYDSDLLDATDCTVTQGAALCNLTHNENALRMVMVDAFDGLSGVVGSVTFHALGSAGTTSNLQVVLTTCGDPEGTALECATKDGTIAIASHAPTLTPSPTPTMVPEPTSTPSPSLPPTSTPAPTDPPLLWGDVNCDGSLNSVDALTLMRHIARLPVQQVEPCPPIGEPYP